MGETAEDLIAKVKTMLEAGDEKATQLLTGIQGIVPIKSEPGAQHGSAAEISTVLSKMKIGQITKLRKFEKGENFSRFCERFREYVEIIQIADANLHWHFLQHVDDETYSTMNLLNSIRQRSETALSSARNTKRPCMAQTACH